MQRICMLVAMDLHYEVGVSARSILASTIELGSGPDGWMDDANMHCMSLL